MNKTKNNNQGFTLLELLVVALIIGILAGIALPQYKKVIERTRAMEAVQTVKTVSDAMERYYLANGVFPTGNWQNMTKDLDIKIPTDNKYFNKVTYDNLYIGMTRIDKDKSSLYAITKVFNPMLQDYKRGLTCHAARGREGGFWGNVCRDLCKTKELTTIWGSGEKGCKIKF